MAAETLRELFIEEVRDMYDGEKRLTKALPRLAKAATSEELQEALTSHLEETETQMERLERVLESFDEPVKGKRCHGIEGIVEEGKKALDDLDEGPLLDAAIIAGCQKVEHYEIASYGTLAYMAELLGESEAQSLLGETLDEEKAADEKLNVIATSRVSREALAALGSEAEDEEDGEEDEEDEEDDEEEEATASSGRGRKK